MSSTSVQDKAVTNQHLGWQVDIRPLPTPSRSAQSSGSWCEVAMTRTPAHNALPPKQHLEQTLTAAAIVGMRRELNSGGRRRFANALKKVRNVHRKRASMKRTQLGQGARWQSRYWKLGRRCQQRSFLRFRRTCKQNQPPVVPPQQQIEYYFSESNILCDPYLQSLMDENGWVQLAEIVSFPRMRRLGTDIGSAASCIAESDTVELAIDRQRVRIRSSQLRANVAMQAQPCTQKTNMLHAVPAHGAGAALEREKLEEYPAAFSKQLGRPFPCGHSSVISTSVTGTSPPCEAVFSEQQTCHAKQAAAFTKSQKWMMPKLQSPPLMPKPAAKAMTVFANSHIALKSASKSRMGMKAKACSSGHDSALQSVFAKSRTVKATMKSCMPFPLETCKSVPSKKQTDAKCEGVPAETCMVPEGIASMPSLNSDLEKTAMIGPILDGFRKDASENVMAPMLVETCLFDNKIEEQPGICLSSQLCQEFSECGPAHDSSPATPKALSDSEASCGSATPKSLSDASSATFTPQASLAASPLSLSPSLSLSPPRRRRRTASPALGENIERVFTTSPLKRLAAQTPM